MTHSAWWLFCDALAVYRLAVLITEDKITEPARDWLQGRAFAVTPEAAGGYTVRKGKLVAWWFYELIVCPWCIGIWLSAAAVALTKFAPGAWQYPALGLTLSGVAGLLAERTDH